MMPLAHIGHSSSNRLRIKVDCRKGDPAYFERATRELMDHFHFASIQFNDLTGSILIMDETVSASEVAAYALDRQLFSMDASARKNEAIINQLVAPLESFHQKVQRTTDGALDLPGLIFILALFFGIYEIAKGNFRSPPWHTAFWYAFGIYSKSYFDRNMAGNQEKTA